MGRQRLQPFFVILVQPALVVIDEHAGGDVHSVNEAEAFLHAAFLKDGFNLWSDVNVFAVLAGMKLQVFGVEFHGDSLRYRQTVPKTD